MCIKLHIELSLSHTHTHTHTHTNTQAHISTHIIVMTTRTKGINFTFSKKNQLPLLINKFHLKIPSQNLAKKKMQLILYPFVAKLL